MMVLLNPTQPPILKSTECSISSIHAKQVPKVVKGADNKQGWGKDTSHVWVCWKCSTSRSAKLFLFSTQDLQQSACRQYYRHPFRNHPRSLSLSLSLLTHTHTHTHAHTHTYAHIRTHTHTHTHTRTHTLHKPVLFMYWKPR